MYKDYLIIKYNSSKLSYRMSEPATSVHFNFNEKVKKFLYDLNKKLNSAKLENGNEKQVLLDYRKNLINIPNIKYYSNLPDDLILAYYNRFTLISYIHFSPQGESIEIENVNTIDTYQNKGNCKFLLSILLIISRLINPNLNILYLDSINKNLSYLCIFQFDAIPRILYYKDQTNTIDDKDDDKITAFKSEVVEMKEKTKDEKYEYITSIENRFGNDLFLVIDINDSIISMIDY